MSSNRTRCDGYLQSFWAPVRPADADLNVTVKRRRILKSPDHVRSKRFELQKEQPTTLVI